MVQAPPLTTSKNRPDVVLSAMVQFYIGQRLDSRISEVFSNHIDSVILCFPGPALSACESPPPGRGSVARRALQAPCRRFPWRQGRCHLPPPPAGAALVPPPVPPPGPAERGVAAAATAMAGCCQCLAAGYGDGGE